MSSIDFSSGKYIKFLIKDFFEEKEWIILDLLSDEDPVVNADYDQLSDLYDRGYYLFTTGKFEEALKLFQTLIKIAPSQSHYWRALGAVNQQLENYNDAILGYDKAIELDMYDIISYIYRGECKILSGNIDSAIEDFNKVIDLGAVNPADKPWIERAKLLIEIHSKK